MTAETPGYMMPSIKTVVSHSIAADPKPASTSNTDQCVKLFYEEGDKFYCVVCHKSYKSLGTLGNHLRTAHGQTFVIKCDKCNTVFEDARALNRHAKAKQDCSKLATS